MYEVTEFRETWQMEGCFAGMPVHLLRFAACNLNCSFCDEVAKATEPFEISLDDIASKVSEESNLLLTGGEPLLGIDEELIRFVRESSLRLYIETNGTIAFPDYMSGYLATVSPKYGSSIAVDWRNVLELKYVVPGDWPDLSSIIESVNSIVGDNDWIDWRFICFQPMWEEDSSSTRRNQVLTVDWAQEFKRRVGFLPRLSIQGHKVLGIV